MQNLIKKILAKNDVTLNTVKQFGWRIESERNIASLKYITYFF